VPNASAETAINESSALPDRSLDSIIHSNDLDLLDAGSVVIVGYPFEAVAVVKDRERVVTPQTRTTTSVSSAATQTPRLVRKALRQHKFGRVENGEWDVDLSRISVLDIGDVLAGKSIDETRSNLVTTVAELCARDGMVVYFFWLFCCLTANDK
jgi:hypothetical protein